MEERRLRAFEHRMLSRIFGPNRDKVTEDWRRLHSEERHDLCSPPNIIGMVKSRRMKWAVHIALIQERGIQDFCVQIQGKYTFKT
jgi:hypothetical protein